MTHCDICEELYFAWRNLPLVSAERWQVWAHVRTCAVALAEYEQARAQISPTDTVSTNVEKENKR